MTQTGSPTRRKPRFRERNAARRVPAPLPGSQLPPSPAPPARRAAARRALPRLSSALTVEQALYAAIVLAAFLLRIWDVGARAMHGDESVHAWMAWNLYNGTGYQYDPVYHGPLQFLVTAAFFFLFGVSNVTARLMAVLFGTALVVLPVALRGLMGRGAALIASAFVALSPAFVYVSRLERDDIFTSFFAFVMAICIFGFVGTRQRRYFYLGFASAALSLSAMENTYITLFVFGTFVILTLIGERLGASSRTSPPHSVWNLTGNEDVVWWPMVLASLAAFVLALALTIVTGWYLPVPIVLVIIIAGWVLRQAYFRAASSGETALLSAIASVNRQEWLNAATIVVAILVLTFSTFGTDLRGIWDYTQPLLNPHAPQCTLNSYVLNPCRKDIIGGLFYWLSQHSVHRGGQPWFYYSLLFGLYEQIAVFLGLGAVMYFLRRPSIWTSFLTYWAVLMFGIYSWAGEKFSWLMIHPLLPFLLLAAMLVARALRSAPSMRLLVVAAGAILGLIQIHNLYEVNFVNGADPVEMMVYVQSSPDTPGVAQNILDISNKATNGPDLPVTIDADETWPFAWYLRDMTHAAYPSSTQILQKPFSTNPVIIVDESDQPALLPKLDHAYTGHEYILRWWFPEDYKQWTWSSFLHDAVNPGDWRVITDWFMNRRPFGPKGSVRFYYYVKKGFVSPY